MYNDILDAVTRRLNELFGDDYEIYTDPVKQGLTEPCFFVQILEPTEKPMIGCRYYRETGFVIQYLPKETPQTLREMNRAAELLMPDLDERLLTFLVSYGMFVVKSRQEETTMETIEIEKGMVK